MRLTCRLFPQYENESEDSLKYSLVRCSSHKLSSTASAYIMENGFFIFVLITTAGCANVKFLNAIFGPNVDSALKIPMEMVSFKLVQIGCTDHFEFLLRVCPVFSQTNHNSSIV